jgi:hypothetical protein
MKYRVTVSFILDPDEYGPGHKRNLWDNPNRVRELVEFMLNGETDYPDNYPTERTVTVDRVLSEPLK